MKKQFYVIKNKGRDVIETNSFFAALSEKFFLNEIFNFLNSLGELLFSHIKTYTVFMKMKEIYDELLNRLIKILNIVDPVMAFSFSRSFIK